MTTFAGNIIGRGFCSGCQEYADLTDADPFEDQGRCLPCALFHGRLNGGTLPCDHFILSYQQIVTSDIAGGPGEVDIFYQCLGSCKSASLFPPYHAEYEDPPIIWLLPEANSPEVQQTGNTPMLLVPDTYYRIYNQGFPLGWNQAWAENIAQAHRETQAWQQRQDQARQAGTPFSEPPPENIYMTRPVFRPPPPPWQEPELPHRLALTQIGVITFLTAAVSTAILLISS